MKRFFCIIPFILGGCNLNDSGVTQPDQGTKDSDAIAICGNEIEERGEECDSTVPNEKSCESVGLQGGIARCTDQCKIDYSNCSRPMTQDMSDASSDMSNDGSDLVEEIFASPTNPTYFDSDVPFLVRAAAQNGTGVVVVGTTPNFANLDRDAVAIHFDATGFKWALRVGDQSNDQFSTAATDGTTTVLGGMSRGYSFGNSNNNDVLFVQVNENGLVSASNYGTSADEFILNIFPGGQVAKWIGVGEYRDEDPRDGLVFAIDENLQPIWARAIDMGGDDFLTGGVVIGDAIYVVGNSTSATSRNGSAFVARIDNTSVTWARRSTTTNSNAIAVYESPDDSGLTVAGQIDGRPSTYNFTINGEVSGTIWNIANTRLVNGISFGSRNLIHGIQNNGAPFIFSPDDASPTAIMLNEGLQTSAYLPAALAVLNGERRLFAETAKAAVLDIPFSLTPETSCVGPQTVDVTTTPLSNDAFEPVFVTEIELNFEGGPISDIRSIPLPVEVRAGVCGP